MNEIYVWLDKTVVQSLYKWKQFYTSIRFVCGSLILFTKCSRQSCLVRSFSHACLHFSEQRGECTSNTDGWELLRQFRWTVAHSRPRPCGRRRSHKNVPQTAEASTIFSFQRYPRLWQHHHRQEEVQQATHHPPRRGAASGTRRHATWVHHLSCLEIQIILKQFRHTQRLVNSNDGKVFCRVCSDKYWETRVDGAYQQVHWRLVAKK